MDLLLDLSVPNHLAVICSSISQFQTIWPLYATGTTFAINGRKYFYDHLAMSCLLFSRLRSPYSGERCFRVFMIVIRERPLSPGSLQRCSLRHTAHAAISPNQLMQTATPRAKPRSQRGSKHNQCGKFVKKQYRFNVTCKRLIEAGKLGSAINVVNFPIKRREIAVAKMPRDCCKMPRDYRQRPECPTQKGEMSEYIIRGRQLQQNHNGGWNIQARQFRFAMKPLF
jgi:hypothetical protein